MSAITNPISSNATGISSTVPQTIAADSETRRQRDLKGDSDVKRTTSHQMPTSVDSSVGRVTHVDTRSILSDLSRFNQQPMGQLTQDFKEVGEDLIKLFKDPNITEEELTQVTKGANIVVKNFLQQLIGGFLDLEKAKKDLAENKDGATEALIAEAKKDMKAVVADISNVISDTNLAFNTDVAVLRTIGGISSAELIGELDAKRKDIIEFLEKFLKAFAKLGGMVKSVQIALAKGESTKATDQLNAAVAQYKEQLQKIAAAAKARSEEHWWDFAIDLFKDILNIVFTVVDAVEVAGTAGEDAAADAALGAQALMTVNSTVQLVAAGIEAIAYQLDSNYKPPKALDELANGGLVGLIGNKKLQEAIEGILTGISALGGLAAIKSLVDKAIIKVAGKVAVEEGGKVAAHIAADGVEKSADAAADAGESGAESAGDSTKSVSKGARRAALDADDGFEDATEMAEVSAVSGMSSSVKSAKFLSNEREFIDQIEEMVEDGPTFEVDALPADDVIEGMNPDEFKAFAEETEKDGARFMTSQSSSLTSAALSKQIAASAASKADVGMLAKIWAVAKVPLVATDSGLQLVGAAGSMAHPHQKAYSLLSGGLLSLTCIKVADGIASLSHASATQQHIIDTAVSAVSSVADSLLLVSMMGELSAEEKSQLNDIMEHSNNSFIQFRKSFGEKLESLRDSIKNSKGANFSKEVKDKVTDLWNRLFRFKRELFKSIDERFDNWSKSNFISESDLGPKGVNLNGQTIQTDAIGHLSAEAVIKFKNVLMKIFDLSHLTNIAKQPRVSLTLMATNIMTQAAMLNAATNIVKGVNIKENAPIEKEMAQATALAQKILMEAQVAISSMETVLQSDQATSKSDQAIYVQIMKTSDAMHKAIMDGIRALDH